MNIYSLGSSVLRTSALGIAAALLVFPGLAAPSYAATQTSPHHLRLVSANASLVSRLNSRDAKTGQTVTAKLTSEVKTSNSMELPRGTMLIGKVDHVQMSEDNGPAKISVVFNEARLKDGHTIPIKATLLAAYPNSSWNSFNYTGVGGPFINTQSHYIPYDQKIDQEPGTLSHVAMHSAVQSQASGVFTSKDRNIDLRSGTVFQIAIAPRISAMG
jgi:hypothetical protein